MNNDITPLSAFERYQNILPRLPVANFPKTSFRLDDVSRLIDQFEVFVFDAYGVLNIGDTPINGAAAFIENIRHAGKQVFVLTNSASLSRQKSKMRFENLGFDFMDHEIVTSRDALSDGFDEFDPQMTWGVISGHHADIHELPCHGLYMDKTTYDACDGFILMNTSNWNNHFQHLLLSSLKARPRPVLVGNPDLVALHEYGFSYQPGWYAHDIWDQLGIEPCFFGKPYGNVFERVRAAHAKNVSNASVLMIGDTLHTDILGGAAAGFSTALMLGYGVLQGIDEATCIEKSGIVPNFILDGGYPDA